MTQPPLSSSPSSVLRPLSSVYIHWPFCKSKCPYCDFNSHVREGIDSDALEKAYLQELDYFADTLRGRKLLSIFFGGGTPSLMPPRIAEKLIDRITNLCFTDASLEITFEANPTSVEAEKFKAFRQAGINRVSLGVQSLRAEDLRFLGREHNVEEAKRAIDLARSTFDRYSFDLIYARPGQTLAGWEQELTEALQMAGDHLSLYQLTIEKGTAFYGKHLRQEFTMPDDELGADFYELTQSIMETAGMPAYEISNHARPGQECRHNLAYWELRDYLGIGAGAHSRVHFGDAALPEALMTIHQPEAWLEAVQKHGHGMQQRSLLTYQERLEELWMMGLRLRTGIARARFKEVAGKSIEETVEPGILSHLQRQGLLVVDEPGIRTTPQGRLVVNGIIKELLK